MTMLSHALLLSALSGPAPAVRPLHTYSIVARDAATGELGVAVQSHWFGVGPVVAWAEAGVGAVATQSLADPSYGHLGLQLMRAGKSASQALSALLAADDSAAVRQVAMVDLSGGTAVHTGERCIAHAGHATGDGYSVQANIMASTAVWPAMARAFEDSSGPLAERLLAALDAAEQAGGDARGRQSAALLVVGARGSGRPWVDRTVDLRVDDSRQPLAELRRLLRRHRAYELMNAGDDAQARNDNSGALEHYSAAAKLVSDEPELRYWHAVALANMDRIEEALPLFLEVFASAPVWIEITPRLAQSGFLSKEHADRVVAAAGRAGR